MVQPKKPQITIQKGKCAFWMSDNQGCRHTLRMCNTYCFTTRSQKAPRCYVMHTNIACLVNAPPSTAVQSVKGAHHILRSAKPSSVPDPVRRHGDKWQDWRLYPRLHIIIIKSQSSLQHRTACRPALIPDREIHWFRAQFQKWQGE